MSERQLPLCIKKYISFVRLRDFTFFFFFKNGVGGETEVQEGGHMCIPMADSC